MMDDGLPSIAKFRRRTRELLSFAGYSTREQILEMLHEIRRERMEERYGLSLPDAGKMEDAVVIRLMVKKTGRR